MKKEKKQLKELSDEELKQVTGGKEQHPNSQENCENQEDRLKCPDGSLDVFTATADDLK